MGWGCGVGVWDGGGAKHLGDGAERARVCGRGGRLRAMSVGGWGINLTLPKLQLHYSS